MKFVIVVLDSEINVQIAADYFACILANDHEAFGIVREESKIKETIDEITKFKENVKRIDREVKFKGKTIKLVKIEAK